MTTFLARADRARLLAERRSEARDALSFYSEIAGFQNSVDPANPLSSLPRLIELVETCGPEPLRAEARVLDEARCRAAIESYLAREDMSSPRSFFARVLLQVAPPRASERSDGCPRCGNPPQVGCLRPVGDGTALSLVCSLCFFEWPFPRGRCNGCRGAVEFHEASELPHLRVQTCASCRRYLHIVRMDAEPAAIPEVDELAALSLDVWARGQGYEKNFPNLLGI
ncbi:MAG: formate dehydrogenase accessory protein FdhE [Vicinamibacteria bacterium]